MVPGVQFCNLLACGDLTKTELHIARLTPDHFYRGHFLFAS
jgi:hypothetical protein